MNWWRAYHGLPNDPKLALVASVTPCNTTRGHVTMVFVTLLDHASQNVPRGSLDGVDPEQIAYTLEMGTEEVSAIIETFKTRNIIVGNRLKAWDKRQPKREREDNSTERVRSYRQRQKETDEPEVKHHVTPRNAQRRGEESIEETTLGADGPAFALSPTEPKPAKKKVAPRKPANSDWPEWKRKAWNSLLSSDPERLKCAGAKPIFESEVRTEEQAVWLVETHELDLQKNGVAFRTSFTKWLQGAVAVMETGASPDEASRKEQPRSAVTREMMA
jgi:hypothetical protein